MFFAIDYDSRKVESKNENDNLLQKYILNNNLELAVALVSSEEELVLKFTLNEMQDLYTNLNGTDKIENEQIASQKCWDLLQQSPAPKFTRKLSDKLLKRYAKNERSVSNTTPKKKKEIETNTARRSGNKNNLRSLFKGMIKE